MKPHRVLLLSVPAVLALSTDAFSRGTGYYSSTVTRSTPSCGSCHSSNPGGVSVFVDPIQRSLSASAATSIIVRVSGPSGTTGGMACDVTAGTLSPGTNTTITNGGLTHSNNSARTWTFGYTAPSSPGPVDLYTVAMASNGSGSSGDSWAFFGSDPAATQSTPVRMFVNAPGVVAYGTSCVGSYGNVPVAGSRQTPSVGNASFSIEMWGAAPSSPASLLLGVTAYNPGIDLTFLGVSGCFLFVDPVATFAGTTSGGSAPRGEGNVTFPVPLPNVRSMIGHSLHFQALVVDSSSGRRTPLTLTNGLTVTFQ
ncbi:MAG: choice-of-anchor V domain-containing protein [Planctomycetota bacterium]